MRSLPRFRDPRLLFAESLGAQYSSGSKSVVNERSASVIIQRRSPALVPERTVRRRFSARKGRLPGENLFY